jgi:Winged helix-turn helix
MPKYIALAPHLSEGELYHRYRQAKDPHERSRWQILWLLSQRQTARAVAASTGYSPYWVGQIAKRYHAEGPSAVYDPRRRHRVGKRLLSAEQLEHLRQAVAGPPPEGDAWTGRTVAEWMSRLLGRPVPYFRGWAYLVLLRGKRLRPRPQHVQADPQEQQAFKKT